VQTLPPALKALENHRQFVLYHVRPSLTRKGKTDKITVDPRTGLNHDAHDSSIHLSFDEAVRCAGEHYHVGFAFTQDDPFFFLDIDNCLVDGAWSSTATGLMNDFAGAAVEVSGSKNGLHIIGTLSSLPEHRTRDQSQGLELYTTKRFCALTGLNTVGDASTNHDVAFAATVQNHEGFRPRDRSLVSIEAWREEPVPEWSGAVDDGILIERACQSAGMKSVFGNGATFRDLWEKNEAVLSLAYPTNNDDDVFGASEADAALASHLAFWTGKNHTRIEALMWKSALKRDKWLTHPTYLREFTITGAVNGCNDVYGSGQGKTSVEIIVGDTLPATLEPRVVEGVRYMMGTQQIEHFRGCVYIRDQNKIYSPEFGLLDSSQFRATYGGWVFSLDSQNDKTSKNAWEIFTESQAIVFPKVDSTCFRPALPEHCIVREECLEMINIYKDIETVSIEGDPTPFLNHIEKLFPDNRDRKIIINYMASLVQNPGVKFQYAPLIQGVEGNGKTTLAKVITHCVGKRYTHTPNPQGFGASSSNFNSWVRNRLFIALEEVYFSSKRSMIEALKPLITNDRIEIQGKGADQVTDDNWANWMMFSNYKDALMNEESGRRYSIFYTPQQSVADRVRDGMTDRYFKDLYTWLNTGGYEICNNWLRTLKIEEEFDPATGMNAPKTSSTSESLTVSLGSVEQEIIEAIEEGRQGFRGDWVSSVAVNRLMAEKRIEGLMPLNKRKAMLEKLGYEWHPDLPLGRSPRTVTSEGACPKLFIRTGSEMPSGLKQREVVRMYEAAQGYSNFGVDGTGNSEYHSGSDNERSD